MIKEWVLSAGLNINKTNHSIWERGLNHRAKRAQSDQSHQIVLTSTLWSLSKQVWTHRNFNQRLQAALFLTPEQIIIWELLHEQRCAATPSTMRRAPPTETTWKREEEMSTTLSKAPAAPSPPPPSLLGCKWAPETSSGSFDWWIRFQMHNFCLS